MKLTMLKCIEALNSFNKVSQCDIPFKQSYIVAQNISALESIVTPFESKRNEFIETLKTSAYENEDGKTMVPDEAAESFRKDVEELLEEEHEVTVKKINLYGVDFNVKASDIKGCIQFIDMKE